MKKYISVLMLIVLLAACTQVANRSSQQHTTVAPLPSGLDVAHLADATVAARFDVNQIDWDRGTISMGIFVEDRYDAAEISQLAVGDTLAFEGCGIVVDSIRFEGDCVCINGGIEFGGADLVADDGGTYRGRMMDDHGSYSCIGTRTRRRCGAHRLRRRTNFAFCNHQQGGHQGISRTRQRE